MAAFDIMKKETCIVCNKEIKINTLMYYPPVCIGNNKDEGLYNGQLNGYVCPKCFGEVTWNEEDVRALRHDWGWNYNNYIFDDEEDAD